MNKSESKYFNTALRMDEALLALLEKKDFEYISIKEVCHLAGVNRSTFYLHYENMRDLLEETVSMMHGRFLSYFGTGKEGFPKRIPDLPREELFLITPEYLSSYLSFILDHKRLYMATLKRPADFHSEETYGTMFRHVFDPILERFSVPGEERSYMMTFYLSGIAAIISEWLADDCRKPTEFIVGMIIKCIPQCPAAAGT